MSTLFQKKIFVKFLTMRPDATPPPIVVPQEKETRYMVLTKNCIGNINPRKSFNVFNFVNFYYAAATRADYFIVISYAHKIVYIVFVHYFRILPKHNLCGCFKVFLHNCYPLFSFLFPWNNYSITQDCILVNTFFKKIFVKFLTMRPGKD